MTAATEWAFGIEIEVFMPAEHVFDMGSYHAGRQVRPIDGWLARGWKAERDGSVTGHAPAGFVGVEIVSPVLYGIDGLTEVVCMVDWLTEIGARMGRQCGQHVSVDARSLTPDQVLAIEGMFRKLERGLYLVNGDKAAERYANSFCPPVASGATGRYRALNVTNYLGGGRETSRLEFRLWAGTLDAQQSVTYILASVALVAGVSTGHIVDDVPADAVGQLKTLAHEYILKHRVVEADQEVDLTDICRGLLAYAEQGAPALV